MNIKINTSKIKEVKIGDSIYPKKLLHIYAPPKILYVLGNETLLNQPSISVIGCRQCTEYGKKVSKYFAEEFSKRGINVISGLAKGIDTYAHQGVISTLQSTKNIWNNTSKGTMNNLGNTIAVLGCGLDVIYPAENIELYKQIIQNGGAIITEYPLGTAPLKQHFPARNRIISGLSDGVLVIEAKERSGTLITVEHALEQGKDVYAVPRKYIKQSVLWNK